MTSPLTGRVVMPAALAMALVVTAGHQASAGGAEGVSARQAIARAAAERLGSSVLRVEVDGVSTTVADDPLLAALPDPAAVVGRPARFGLIVNGRRRGVAVARVRVRARLVRVAKAIERGALIDPDAVALVEGDVDGVRFSRLPSLADVVGGRARRDLTAGEVVTRQLVAAPPAVASGDRVVVGVTIGRVHVASEGVASGSGEIGDVVHVVQPGRRALLKARVVERGVVEVMP